MKFLLISLLFALSFAPALAADSPLEVFDSLPGATSTARVRLLTDNHDAWYARWWVLDHAAKTLDCTYFSASTDLVGRSFLGKLLEKARSGLRIRLMVDARGSAPLFNPIFHQDYLAALASFPNVTVRVYNDYSQKLRSLPAAFLDRITSDHSKLIIADGTWLVAGGRNLKDHWYTSPRDDPKAIRDADVLVCGGSAAAQATRAFEEEFDGMRNARVSGLAADQLAAVASRLDLARQTLESHMTRQPLEFGTMAQGAAGPLSDDTLASLQDELEIFRSMQRYSSFDVGVGARQCPVVVLGKHSRVNALENEVTDALTRLVRASRKEIVIASAYLVLTDKARAALREASSRGVQIRILTNSPESTHSLMTQAWFVKEWKDYLRDIPTLRLFALADRRKLHGKIFTFDGEVSIVGSYNLDPMSEQINGEDIAVVRSQEMAADLHGWHADLMKSALEYRIRIEPDGRVTPITGPSDHCSRLVLWVLGLIGRLEFLRPVI